MQRVLMMFMGLLCIILAFLSHVDRKIFLSELKQSREIYINSITNLTKDINVMKKDIKDIKSIVESREIVDYDKQTGSGFTSM